MTMMIDDVDWPQQFSLGSLHTLVQYYDKQKKKKKQPIGFHIPKKEKT
jgi:hypothetical protein